MKSYNEANQPAKQTPNQIASRIAAFEGEALKRICEEIYELPKQPDEFTILEVAEQTGISYKSVQNRLNAMVKKGLLSCRGGHTENGNRTKLFKYLEN